MSSGSQDAKNATSMCLIAAEVASKMVDQIPMMFRRGDFCTGKLS